MYQIKPRSSPRVCDGIFIDGCLNFKNMFFKRYKPDDKPIDENSRQEFLDILGKLETTLSKFNHPDHAAVIQRLHKSLLEKEHYEFKRGLNTVDMWGGQAQC